MSENNKRPQQAKLLRDFRKVHRLTGTFLFVFFFVVAITGLLLGYKKHSRGFLLPDTQVGISDDFKTWLPLDSLYNIALTTRKSIGNGSKSTEIDKIDVRLNNGIVKYVFADDNLEIQLDGTTGEVLNIGQRWSDLVEHIHDGSILDQMLGVKSGIFKLFYTTVMGLALITFTVTGFWLWYGPKQMRKSN